MRRSTSGGGGTPTPTIPPTLADWDPTLVRYFFLDYDAGSDAKIGYIDAAAGTVFAAGAGAAVAIKTFTKLFEIVPLLGNNRSFVVLMKPRASAATYLDDDGVTPSAVDWSAVTGYKLILRRASHDFTNSTSDRVRAGFQTALAGPDAGGAFTCLAGATTTVWSVTGTPFSATDLVNTGYRVRFTGNVTAALADICTSIQINTTSQITASVAVTAIPAVGDTFFLELPALAVQSYTDGAYDEARTSQITSTLSRGYIRDVGILVKGAVDFAMEFFGAPREICGCAQDSTATATVFRLADCDFAAITGSYSDETNTLRRTGLALRLSATSWSINRIRQLDADVFVHARTGGSSTIDRVQYGNVMTAAVLGSAMTVRASGHPSPGSGNGFILGTGASGGTNKTRFLATTTLSSVAIVVRGIDLAVTGSGFTGPNFGLVGATIQFDFITGTCSLFVIDFAGAASKGGTYVLGAVVANTAVGTSGDIRASGSALLTFTGLTRTNVVDEQGNEWIGTAGRIVSQCKLVTNSSGGALAIGDVVRGNGTTNAVTSAQADTLANSAVLGIMATAPASGAVGYMVPPGCGTPQLNFTVAPTAGAIVYLSTTTARQATTVEPLITGVLQKVKLGRVVNFSTTTGQITFEPDLKPENTFEVQPLGVAVSNAAATFSATQTWLIATGTYSADRAFTLEALSTLSTNVRRIVSDFTSGGAFNILLTPNAADSIDGLAAGVALAIPAGSKQTIEVRAMPAGGWKVM